MAFGPVNAGGGASGPTLEGISAQIDAARREASRALEDHVKAENPHGVTTETIGAVPDSRKVNGKPLSGDVSLTASDVGAVPVTRKVNGKSLCGDITLAASDVGAAAANHTHSVFHAGTTAPGDTKLLWIDTNSATGGLKYHNGSAWVHVPVAYT